MGSHLQAGVAADSNTNNLARAQRELEDMYMGVPDESVNLTFQHLAQIKQHQVVTHPMTSPASSSNRKPALTASNTLNKLPSLDFNRSMQASIPKQYHHQTHISNSASAYSPALPPVSNMYQGTDANKFKQSELRSPVNSSRGVAAGRQGIPHSKICAICNRHIYVFRHRCLVCGRVYCRNCVNVGMGEMSEGRKCVECLGRRFSQRYIQMAGKTDKLWWRFCCWLHQSYPDKVRQQEIKWAEKGPRITSRMSTQNNDGRSRSGIIQQQHCSYNYDNPASFVCTTTSSPATSSPYLHF